MGSLLCFCVYCDLYKAKNPVGLIQINPLGHKSVQKPTWRLRYHTVQIYCILLPCGADSMNVMLIAEYVPNVPQNVKLITHPLSSGQGLAVPLLVPAYF